MDHGQRAGDRRIGEVGIEQWDLARKEKPLVYDGAAGEAWNVELIPVLDGRPADGDLHPLSNDVEFALELRFVEDVTGDKDLPDTGLILAGQITEVIVLGRHVPPPEKSLSFLIDDLLEKPFALPLRHRVRREEHHAEAVSAGTGQPNVEFRAGPLHEVVRNLDQNPRAVSRARVAADRPPVRHVFENLEPHLDDAVRAHSLHVDDKTDPTGVFFISGIVQSLFWREALRTHNEA